MGLHLCRALCAGMAQEEHICVRINLMFLPHVYACLLLLLIVPHWKVVWISCRRMLLCASELKIFPEHLGTTERCFLVLADTRLVANSLLLHNLFYQSGSHVPS
jgi:hypothetical protein